MWRSEEAETTRYKGQSSFLFQLRYNYGNRIPSPHHRVKTAPREQSISLIMEVDTRINALWTVDVLRQFSARTAKENQIDLANKQRWIMKQLRCINDAARDILVATSKVTLPKGSRARKFASNPLSGSPELSQPT